MKKRKILLCILLAVLITAVTWLYTGGKTVDVLSDRIVMGRIYQSEFLPGENPGGFLVEYGLYGPELWDSNKWEDPEVPIYSHGCGLQGTMYTGLDRVLRIFSLSLQARMTIWSLIPAFLFWLVILQLADWLLAEFGALGAVLALGGLLSCPTAINGAFSIYWQAWTLFLPVVLSARICRSYKMGRRTLPWILALALALMLRFGCGFEYVSSILIAMEIPVIYEGIRAPSGQRAGWARLFGTLAAVGLAAFGVMFLVWGWQELRHWGSWELVIQDITQTIGKRTGAFAYTGTNELILESLTVPRWKMVWGYLCWETLLAGQTVLRILAGYAVLCVPYLWIVLSRRDETKLRELIRSWLVLFFAACAPISWYVLASGHSVIHMFINKLLWQIPFIPLLLAYVGKMLEEWIPDSILPKITKKKEEAV